MSFEWPAEVPKGQPIPAVGWLREIGVMPPAPRLRRWKVYFDFADWWVGLYIGPKHLYLCPIPTLVFRWRRRARSTPGTIAPASNESRR